MAIVFHSRVPLPVWAVGFGAVALTASPRAILPLLALAGIALIASAVPQAVRKHRVVRAPGGVLPTIERDPSCNELAISAGHRRRTLDELRTAASRHGDDVADSVRMDDDGGSQPRVQTVIKRDVL
jgi:hypothetical protein